MYKRQNTEIKGSAVRQKSCASDALRREKDVATISHQSSASDAWQRIENTPQKRLSCETREQRERRLVKKREYENKMLIRETKVREYMRGWRNRQRCTIRAQRDNQSSEQRERRLAKDRENQKQKGSAMR